MQKWSAYLKEYRLKKKQEGKCYGCSGILDDIAKSICSKCRRKASERIKAAVAAGMCRVHPKTKAVPGRTKCEDCLVIDSIQRKRPESLVRAERNYRLRNYGIDQEAYQSMLSSQDGRCAICRNVEPLTRHGKQKSLTVDHCHSTGAVRGLLCTKCNSGIGMFGDREDVMAAAIEYLRRSRGVTR